MLICSLCAASADDSQKTCPNCGADLTTFSTIAVSRQTLKGNPRVYAVNIATSRDSCPACKAVQGTYKKDEIPELPVPGCSHKNGCRCSYQPLLESIYP